MIMNYEEARRSVVDQLDGLPGVRVPLDEARNLIVADDIVSAEPFPTRDYSAINGYAVRSMDTKGASKEFPVEAKVVKQLKAGDVYKRTLGEKDVVRLMAGAVLPPGADAVVMIEDTDRIGKSVKILKPAAKGENVRARGEDIGGQEVVLKKGRRIRPQEIAMLAALGMYEVTVRPKPQVALLTTGDDQAEIGKRRRDGQVWNCLRPMLKAMIDESGGVTEDLGHAKEKPWYLRRKIREGLHYPILILAGGLFVRQYDLIKEVLARLNVKEVFWRVNIRPGRPVYFGRSRETLVFGLPDTSGAAFVDFEEFVRPAILKLSGRERLFRREITAVAGTDIKNRSRRMFFVRSFLRRNGRNVTVFPSGSQHSHMIKTLSRSNALVALDEHRDFVHRGDRVRVKLLD